MTSKKLKFTVACMFAVFTAGCANQATVWRVDDTGGKTAAMDATQRVVVSNTKVTTHGNITRYCLEPSPDAIVAVASSLGIGASIPFKGATLDAQGQGALAAQVASIGLRTPTIQTLRDLITATCLADMNGSFDSKGFTEAFERNQDFVLAAHAIAVIGGEPAARQFMLNTSASTGPSDDALAALKEFKSSMAARQKAEADLATAEAATKKATQEWDTATKSQKDAEAKVPKDDAAITAAKTDVTTRTAALNTAKATEAKAKTTLVDAQKSEKKSEAISDALAAGLSTATGSGSDVAPVTLARPAGANLSSRAIAAIGGIFSTTLLQGFSLERCINHLVRVSQLQVEGKATSDLFDKVAELCTAVSEEKKKAVEETAKIFMIQ